jgi:cellulose synthase/poly-beta-1,6-N-acetylglucosamine synthase-like glycosyltransferase
MITALIWMLTMLTLPVLLVCTYLGVFTLLSARLELPAPSPSRHRFRFIVPAHNEELGIAATVASLLAVDYPREFFEVYVVADNCSDETAARAREAGATVLERHNQDERGKGYALHYAFELVPESVDAIVVIDADTLVSANILHAFSARLAAGANALQADYAVRNAQDAWRTRLMAIALGSFHIVRSRARERLKLSCGLRGNGMCFRTSLLGRVPHQAYSIVEDVEYGIRLASAGERVVYVDEAHVYGEMVSSARAANSQRQRWESGRAGLRKTYAAPLFRAAAASRDRVQWDLLCDILVPPLSQITAAAAAGLTLSLIGLAFDRGFMQSLLSWLCCWCLISAYVFRGWSVSGTGTGGLLALAGAPFYILWKMSLRLRQRKESEWVRTTREGAPKA